MKIILYYVSHNTHPNGGEKQSYIAFYETHALLKQKCGWKEWGLIVWFKNYRHKENIIIQMSFDLIDQRSCNHISYKGPCKCVLDINIITYTQTYARVCMQLHAYGYMWYQ